nr:MAG TPA: hypothetical protein [Caudoviricetes sp.]
MKEDATPLILLAVSLYFYLSLCYTIFITCIWSLMRCYALGPFLLF